MRSREAKAGELMAKPKPTYTLFDPADGRIIATSERRTELVCRPHDGPRGILYPDGSIDHVGERMFPMTTLGRVAGGRVVW